MAVGMILLFLVGFVMLALGIAGLLLLILWLSRRKTGQWVTGLVMLIVVIVLAVPGLGLMIYMRGRAAASARNMWQQVATKAEADFYAEESGDTIAGLPMPPSATMAASGPFLAGGEETRQYVIIDCLDDPRPFLQRKYTAVTFAEVSKELTIPEAKVPEGWNVSAETVDACFRRSGPDSNAVMAYDADTEKIFVVILPTPEE